MASLWKHPNSPFWTACFTDETGRRVKRSTHTADRRAALKIAETLEEAAKKARASELTRATATKLLNELMERTHGDGLDGRSIRQHFTDHTARLEAREKKASTVKRYKPIFDGFLSHLGEARSKARLASVTRQEIESFYDAEVKAGKSRASAAFALKVLNGVFEGARKNAAILANPVPGVLKDLAGEAQAATEERQPFNDMQVSALLEAADDEWQGMILLAYHTGIRLNDAANLTRTNLDGDILRFREAKTAHRKRRASERETVVMLADDLVQYFASRRIPKKPDAPLFPSLYGKKSGSAGGLSNAFARIMAKAGIDRGQGDKKRGKGRRFSAFSFHSLRHTMISRIAASDAPEAVRKAIAGHSSDEAHRRYVHLDVEAQAKVVAQAPRIWRAAA